MQFSNHYLTDGDYAAGKAGVSSTLLHRDGTLYFANSNGLGIVHPKRIRNNQIPPSVAITDISVLNRSLADDFKNADVNLEGSVTEPKALTLSRQTSMFSLRFSALHYADPKHNRYAYKLEGFDRDWVETDSSNRVATYTNLDPGQYLFRVKASNNIGNWNETGSAFPSPSHHRSGKRCGFEH